MSQQRLNLARRPFVDSRPANALVGFFLLVTLALTYFSMRTVTRYFDDSEKTRLEIADLRAEIETLEKKKLSGEATLARFDFGALGESVEEANIILKQRAFSWTRFLTRLEKVLPGEVRVASIRLSRETAAKGEGGTRKMSQGALFDEGVEITLELIARDTDAVPKLVRAFYASEFFDAPEPKSEDGTDPAGKRIQMSVTYQDAGKKKS